MKTGIELIAEERREQIEKHGWSKGHDSNYQNKELQQAAYYCLMLAEYKGYKGQNRFWPEDWGTHFEHKIINKPVISKLIVAGALLMAENARRGDTFHNYLIEEIAAEIDKLNLDTKQQPG
jgi:hypothetical protein